MHAGGSGLERGVQGQPTDFNVWTREAGHGSLAISVEGPSKAIVHFKDRKVDTISCFFSQSADCVHFPFLEVEDGLGGPSTEMARIPCPASRVHTLKSVGWPNTIY